jgi:hypothetical protein
LTECSFKTVHHILPARRASTPAQAANVRHESDLD